ncbi:MAG: SH3 domain-containing protein [Caldilineaceae bacterium]
MNESHPLRQRDSRSLRFWPLWSGLLIFALVAGGCTTTSGQLMTALGQADLGVDARPDDAAPGREEAAVSGAVAPAAAPVLVARILADRLNVRSDPTTDASVVGKLFVGNEVTVLDRADDGAWIQVQVDGVDASRLDFVPVCRGHRDDARARGGNGC